MKQEIPDMKRQTVNGSEFNKYIVETGKGGGGLVMEAGLLAPGQLVQTERTSVHRQMGDLLRLSAASISAPGLCLTSSWTSLVVASHKSSLRQPLMMGLLVY